MVQPKYSPEEALERVKLMMKYDTSKTLNENKEVVSEQMDMTKDIQTLAYEISHTNSDEEKILSIIKKYNNKTNFYKLANAYKERYGQDFGPAIYRAISSRDPQESKELIDWAKTIGIDAKVVPIPGSSGRYMWDFQINGKPKPEEKKGGDGGGEKKLATKYPPCADGFYKKPCKSSKVKQVQACLGMPTIYQTGNFGSITQGYLKKLGKGFENGFKDADIDKICAKKEPEKKDDFGTEIKTTSQDQL